MALTDAEYEALGRKVCEWAFYRAKKSISPEEYPDSRTYREIGKDAHHYVKSSTGCARNQGTTQFCAEAADFAMQLSTLEKKCAKDDYELCQILGKALGYPWYKSDLKNFPNATDEDGVCTGDHVGITLANEAALKIAKLTKENERLHTLLKDNLERL